MTVFLIFLLGILVLRANCGVLNSNDNLLKRITRSSDCPFCHYRYEPGPPPTPQLAWYPPPPPSYHAQQWSGLARSHSGYPQGVFSGATASINAPAQNGPVYSVATSSSDVNCGDEPKEDSNVKENQFHQQPFDYQNNNLRVNEFNHQPNDGNGGREYHAEKTNNYIKSSIKTDNGFGQDVPSIPRGNIKEDYQTNGQNIDAFGNYHYNQNYGTHDSFDNEQHGQKSQSQKGVNLDKSDYQQNYGYNNHGQTHDQLEHTRESDIKNVNTNYKLQNDRNNQQRSDEVNNEDKTNGNIQTTINGAFNLASQGLQAAERQPTGCSTCGRSNYASSNASSHTGDAVAVSIGG